MLATKLLISLAFSLFLNSSPWVTVVETYNGTVTSGEYKTYYRDEYRYRADENRNMCYLQYTTEETDENGVVWTVYHYGSETVNH